MKLVDLNATVREKTGKEAALKMRASGQIPAIIYGADGDKAMPVSVSARELEKIIKDTKTSQVFLRLTDVSGSFEPKNALLKELQTNPGTRAILHADFYEIASMDKKIRTKALVTTVGKPAGIVLGGVLKIIIRELDIICSSADVPETIEINVADMKLGDTILAGDIDLGDSVKIANDPSVAVVTLVPPKRSEGADK